MIAPGSRAARTRDGHQAAIATSILVPLRVSLHPRRGNSPRECRYRATGLAAGCALPDLKPLDGGTRWAEVRLGWNSGGLGITRHCRRRDLTAATERRPEGFAVAQFWVDTRDTRNVSRATKFCHRFVVRLDRGDSRGRLEAQVTPRPIARGSRGCAACRLDDIPVRVELSRTELASRTVPVRTMS